LLAQALLAAAIPAKALLRRIPRRLMMDMANSIC
jgi:hypothetical protein